VNGLFVLANPQFVDRAIRRHQTGEAGNWSVRNESCDLRLRSIRKAERFGTAKAQESGLIGRIFGRRALADQKKSIIVRSGSGPGSELGRPVGVAKAVLLLSHFLTFYTIRVVYIYLSKVTILSPDARDASALGIFMLG
jgi:hypothetical protein